MQPQKRIASTGCSKDPETSQITADGSVGTFTNISGIPRLARKYLFERGVQRKVAGSRDDRNMWARQHDSYKAKMPVGLQPAGGGEDRNEGPERSYFLKGAQGVKSETGYMSAATSRGGKWTEESEDACIARDENCAERKAEDLEFWVQLPKLDTDVVDDANVSAAMDESSGKGCPSKRAPTSAKSVSGKSTDDEPSHDTFYSSSDSSSSSSSSSHPTHLSLHLRTPSLSDPNLDPIARDPTSPSSSIFTTTAHDARLDACITKTRVLLTAGREALGSTAEAGFEDPRLCVHDDVDDNKSTTRKIKADAKEDSPYSLPHLPSYNNPTNPTTPFPPTLDWKAEAEEENERMEAERKEQQNFAQSVETAVLNGIVGVQNWYKIRGAGEAWREMNGGGSEYMVGLVGGMGRDVDVDVCESETVDCMF